MNDNQDKLEELLERHISLWEKEKDKSEGYIKQAKDVLWNIRKEKTEISCKKGLSVKDTICIECNKARPKFNSWQNVFEYPGNKKKKSFSEEDAQTRDCSEWAKKERTTACGCGGTYECLCGYREGFCCHEDSNLCPFCERECTIKYSEMLKMMDTSFIKGMLKDKMSTLGA